jgi:YidC/Oxa1 family membrane protein insertase
MIPLFFKQIMASRKMQMIQPELQKIQKKYKGKSDPESRQAMTQETMALYKKEGTNPFSSCLPILAQSPFFFGLFQVLNGLDDIARGTKDFVGPIDREVAAQAESASIFGAQLSDTFLGSDAINTKIVTVILIVLMSATTFLTQRQLITKNMPASALDNPFAKQQKLLLYVLPIVFAVSGVNFPLGVLIYWFTTNIWSMCQQFYVIRRLPAPGSAAEKAYHARLAKKGKPIPGAEAAAAAAEAEEEKPTGQRVQPTSKKRKKKQGGVVKPAPQSGASGSSAPTAPSTPKTAGQNGQKAGPKQGQKPARKKPGAAAKPPTT